MILYFRVLSLVTPCYVAVNLKVSVDKMGKVISVVLNKLAKKNIERLPLVGILKLEWFKKSELLETNNL